MKKYTQPKIKFEKLQAADVMSMSVGTDDCQYTSWNKAFGIEELEIGLD